jgi:predicted amidophosphoribosyltransferase
MVDHFRLEKHEVIDSGSGNILLLLSGSRTYYSILRGAFSELQFSRAFDDVRNRYSWGTYINKVSDDEIKNIKTLLDLLQRSVYLDDALSQTFALDYHFRSQFDGLGRTEIANLVYHSKHYKSQKQVLQTELEQASKLADKFIEFMQCHPSYVKSDYVVSVPGNPSKVFDLPSFIAERISTVLNIKNGKGLVQRTRNPSPMKDKLSLKEKSENIRGVFKVVDPVPFNGCTITVIDDIYASGVTLHELGTTLERSGATVQGLVATKTLSDPK